MTGSGIRIRGLFALLINTFCHEQTPSIDAKIWTRNPPIGHPHADQTSVFVVLVSWSDAKKNYHFIIGHAHALLTSKCPSRPPCARDRRNRKGEDLYERKINAVQVFRSADIINKTYIFVSVYLKAEGYIELNASDRPFQTLIFDDGGEVTLIYLKHRFERS